MAYKYDFKRNEFVEMKQPSSVIPAIHSTLKAMHSPDKFIGGLKMNVPFIDLVRLKQVTPSPQNQAAPTLKLDLNNSF